MPDPILNTDAAESLTRIANALGFYARSIPNAAVSKVLFQQEPSEETRWRASARLICLGDIRAEGPEFLEGAKPVTVYDHTWESEGEGFAGAVEELAAVVQAHLEKTLTQQTQALSAAQGALRAMDAPINNLSTLWRTEDHPDDHAEEGQP